MNSEDCICKNCRWWSHRKTDDDDELIPFGDCRKDAPRLFQCGDVMETEWPYTNETDWCGAFQMKDDRASRLLGTKFMRGELNQSNEVDAA